MIELQTGNPFAVGEDRGLAELAELAAIDKGFENVLLNVEVVVDDEESFCRSWGSWSMALLTA